MVNMKKIIFFTMLLWPIIQVAAQNASTGKTIKITGTRLAHPIVQRWIDEYTKLHPGVKIVVSPKIPADSADILIASYKLRPGDVKEGKANIALTRYVQLPVVNNRSSNVAALQLKGFTQQDFRRVYFADSSNNAF